MQIRELSFKGHSYKIMAQDDPAHPSTFTFEDESSVRDRDWNIKPGEVVFDLGAGYGSYTLTALAAGAAFVYCWNPNEEENGLMEQSMRINKWGEKYKIFRNGVWSKTGFLRDTDLKFSETECEPPMFRVVALDDQTKDMELSRLDWIKLDVEGAEAEVLAGAGGLMKKFRPKIEVENHIFKDPTIDARVRELLFGLGYKEVRTVPYHGVSHSLYEPG